MKARMIAMFLAIGSASLFGTALLAQNHNLTADVPFGFQAGNLKFAPGAYVISKTGAVGPLSIMPVATRHATFITGAFPSMSGKERARLVFRCYGSNRCFLAEIWSGDAPGSNVPISKAEKDIRNGEPQREVAAISIDLRRAD